MWTQSLPFARNKRPGKRAADRVADLKISLAERQFFPAWLRRLRRKIER